MLFGARQAVLQIIDNGGVTFQKDMHDGTLQSVSYVDICNYLTKLIVDLEDKELFNQENNEEIK